MIQIIVNGIGYNNMKIIKKIYTISKGWIIKIKYSLKIKIREFGTTYVSMDKEAIVGNGMLQLNTNAVSIHETSKIRIDKSGKLILDGFVSFYSGLNLHIADNASARIGNGTYINENTKISIKKKLEIGEECAISNNVSIMDSDFHVLENEKEETGVIIGNHVWIGADVTILKNVCIGDGCVVGARSVVTKSIPSNSLVVGNPARIVKNNVLWK